MMHFRQQPLVVGQVETLLIKITLSNHKETAYRPSLRVTINFSNDFDLPMLSWQWNIRESSSPGKIENFKGNPKVDQESLSFSEVIRRSRPTQNDGEVGWDFYLVCIYQINAEEIIFKLFSAVDCLHTSCNKLEPNES